MKLDEQPRPKLKLPLTKLEIVLEVLSVPPVLLNIALLAVYWQALPNVVPTHFDLSGNPNGWSTKATLVALAVFSVGSYCAMTIAARFPHTFNYIFPISEENASRQYLLARKFLCMLKLESSALMFFALWNMIQLGTGAVKVADVGSLFAWGVMMLISCAVYIFSAYLSR